MMLNKEKELWFMPIKISIMEIGKMMLNKVKDFISLLLEVYIKVVLRTILKKALEFIHLRKMLSKKFKEIGNKINFKGFVNTLKEM